MADAEFRAAVEQHAHIQQVLADIELKQMNRLKRTQDFALAPWALVVSGLTGGAALLGAGAALMAAAIKWLQP